MRQNVLDEIQQPQDKPRETQVIKTHQIVRDAKNYNIYTYPEYKCYKLVFNKRVVDPLTVWNAPIQRGKTEREREFVVEKITSVYLKLILMDIKLLHKH